MTRRRKIQEGDPIAPVKETVSAGLHERDFFIGAYAASSLAAWDRDSEGRFILTPKEVADRVVQLAEFTLERKERV